MRIVLSSIYADDQEKALQFYTRILGFIKKTDVPAGDNRWLTVVSPEQPDGVELLLEPCSFPPAKIYKQALFDAGIPFNSFGVADIQAEYHRLSELGVKFRNEPTKMGPVTIAIFEDTCGNLIQIAQKDAVNPLQGLTITRLLSAPRELVWEAWTNEKHIQKWWGPKGFTNPVCNWNATLGGSILIHMKAPNDVVYPMDGTFLEIVARDKIVFNSAALDNDGNALFKIHNTILFSDEDGKTRLTMHFKVYELTSEGSHYIGGMNEGWNLSIDKLEAMLNS